MNTRHPEMPTSHAPRSLAVIAALLVTAALFDGVASLSGLDSNDTMQNGTTVVAQGDATVVG